MSAHYPKQYQVPDFGKMSEGEQWCVWEALKASLATRDTIEVHFTGIKKPALLRHAIYKNFGGYEIVFNRFTSTRVHVLIGPEKIRTSATTTPTGTPRTKYPKYPKELKRHEEIPAGFGFTLEEEATVGQIARTCPVCMRRLPLEAFNRSSKGRIQSYCIECNRAYQKWRPGWLQCP